MKLSGKRIIVTGSTEGIGAAVAEGLLGDGAEVVLNSHLPDPPADFLDRMRALGPVITCTPTFRRPTAHGRS